MSQPYSSGCAEVGDAHPGPGARSYAQAQSWPPSPAPAKHSPVVESTAGFPFNTAAVAAVVAAIVHEGWKPGKQMWW